MNQKVFNALHYRDSNRKRQPEPRKKSSASEKSSNSESRKRTKRPEQLLTRSENVNQNGRVARLRMRETAWTRMVLLRKRRDQNRKRNECETRSLRAVPLKAKPMTRELFCRYESL